MGRRRRGGLESFADGLNSTFGVFNNVQKIIRENGVRDSIEQVDQNAGQTETPVASGEEARQAGQSALDTAMTNATTDEQRAQVQQNFQPTLDALDKQVMNPAGVVYSVGTGSAMRQADQPFSDTEIEGAKARSKAEVYSRAGRDDEAARVLMNAQRSRAIADEDELRGALKESPQPGMRSLFKASPDDQSGQSSPRNALIDVRGQNSERDSLDHYLKTIAPKAVVALVKQGHIQEAKQYSDFMDSQEGQAYAKTYMQGVHAFHAGDNEGALNAFQTLYNSQAYPDGHTVQFKPLDGDNMQIDQVGADGNVRASKVGKVGDLTKQAALGLNPLMAVSFMADQQAKREHEGALLDRQIQLENLRQSGRQDQEDRRDDRLAKRIDAQAEARAAGNLTLPQQRSNAEIDAARAKITGMDPADIRKRTAKTTDTGRENPDFDPGLARAASLAGRRKIGADDLFDQRSGQQSAASTVDRGDVAARFRSDRGMDSYRLGNPTPDGVEVLDKSGKVIGHYR